MRRLTSDELVDVATELGAEAVGDVSGLAQVQQVDRLVDALASLLVAIVESARSTVATMRSPSPTAEPAATCSPSSPTNRDEGLSTIVRYLNAYLC